MALVGQAVSEKKIFEIVNGRRTDDGRTPDHGHPISSPCEPNGSGELKIKASFSPDILEILNGKNTQLEPNNATIDTNLNICMGNKVLEPNKL